MYERNTRVVNLFIILMFMLNLSYASIGVNGYSAPMYLEYKDESAIKEIIFNNIVENSTLYESSTIYIYYHDSKSKKLANQLQSKLKDKLPAHAHTELVEQESGIPKYPYKYTPDGVAIISKDGKCTKCQQR